MNRQNLTGAQWFSTLDGSSGYLQCKMAGKDKIKEAFTTLFGGVEGPNKN